MGQCGSKVETKIPPGWMELFASLRLTKDEVRKLYSIFCKVDLDGSGSVDTVELLTLLDIERTRFTEQIFAVFDNDGSGKVDFREFVISLWNYCTIGKAALEIFTFDLYDSDSSGELSPGEISMMLKDIYGKNHMNDAKVKMLGCADVSVVLMPLVFTPFPFPFRRIQAELHKIDTRARINLTAFKNFTQTHQGMLFPVFNLQHQLRCNVLGERFWDKASNRRLELSKGRYVTMSDLMLLVSPLDGDYLQ
jgi:Ca2+-binding EF-hand superfamily protein